MDEQKSREQIRRFKEFAKRMESKPDYPFAKRHATEYLRFPGRHFVESEKDME